MDNLTRLLGGPRFLIKRDDCSGLSSGGNNTRDGRAVRLETSSGLSRKEKSTWH